MEIKKEHEAFEKYCIDVFSMCPASGCFDRELEDPEFYESIDTHRLWKLWQLISQTQAIPEGFVLIPAVFPEFKAQILAEQEVEATSKRIDDKFRGGVEFTDEKKAHLIQMNVGERRQLFRDFFEMMTDLEQINDSH